MNTTTKIAPHGVYAALPAALMICSPYAGTSRDRSIVVDAAIATIEQSAKADVGSPPGWSP